MTGSVARRAARPGTWLRRAGLVLCAVPVGLLLMFAAGESAEGIPGAAGHLVQAAPLIVLIVASLRWPTAAGAGIVAFGAFLAAAYMWRLLEVGASLPEMFWVTGLFFGPAIAGGVLIAASGLVRRDHQGGRPEAAGERGDPGGRVDPGAPAGP